MWSTDNYAELVAVAKHLHDEPHRHYHTWDGHIKNMLRFCFINSDRFNNFEAVVLAVLFHDCVYKVDAESYPKNEMYSASRMIGVLKELMPEYCKSNIPTIALALRMISNTKGHNPLKYQKAVSPNDLADIQRFLDLDLGILATTDANKLVQYEQNVRKEFSIYDDSVYNQHRYEFLKSFAKREQYFFSDIAAPNSNEQARNNIKFLMQYFESK